MGDPARIDAKETGGSAAPSAAAPRPQGLHPSTEIVLLGCSLLVVYGIPSPVVPLSLLLGAIAVAVLSPRVRLRAWLLTLAILAGPMLLMVGIIQGLFYPGDDATVLWRAGPAAVTVEGLSVGLQLWLRVAATIAICALFALGSDAARVFDGLLRLRAPLSIAYVCAATISLIPFLRTRTGQALDARAARGWNTSRLLERLRLTPGILSGLLTASLVQLDQRHETLEQRGFGSVRRPTPLQDHRDGTIQSIVRCAVPLAAVAAVAASLAGALPLPTASDLIGGFRG